MSRGEQAADGNAPRTEGFAMGTGWMEVCTLADIPHYGARKLHVGSITVALIRTDGERVYALEDRCPHRGGPLSEGIVSADRVACPLHGQCVELASGRLVEPDEGCTHTFEVRVVEGKVQMRRDELRAQRPLPAPAFPGCTIPLHPTTA